MVGIAAMALPPFPYSPGVPPDGRVYVWNVGGRTRVDSGRDDGGTKGFAFSAVVGGPFGSVTRTGEAPKGRFDTQTRECRALVEQVVDRMGRRRRPGEGVSGRVSVP